MKSERLDAGPRKTNAEDAGKKTSEEGACHVLSFVLQRFHFQITILIVSEN